MSESGTGYDDLGFAKLDTSREERTGFPEVVFCEGKPDVYLPKIVVKVLDILADLAVCILGLIMLVVGWNYATTLGGRGFYVSMPWLSRFWMYFPVPLAGVAMIIFEIEALYNHIKSFFVKEEN